MKLRIQWYKCCIILMLKNVSLVDMGSDKGQLGETIWENIYICKAFVEVENFLK